MTAHRPSLTREAMREVDRRAIEEYGIPGVVLMENAGRGLTDEVGVALRGVLPDPDGDGCVAILAGKGNNGGDGFVCARHLINRGHEVRLLYVGDLDDALVKAARGQGGDWGINLHVLERMEARPRGAEDAAAIEAARDWLAEADVVVDALLGTGLSGPVREPYQTAIEVINALGALGGPRGTGRPVVAADLPSGLDANEGRPLGAAVRAHRTVTFAARKKGFDAPGAAAYTGAVVVADIGCPASLLEGS